MSVKKFNLDPMNIKVLDSRRDEKQPYAYLQALPRGKDKGLKDPMKQNWSSTGSGYYDQFGFEIKRGRMYKLYWKDVYITETHTLQAAKEISIILINDKIQS